MWNIKNSTRLVKYIAAAAAAGALLFLFASCSSVPAMAVQTQPAETVLPVESRMPEAGGQLTISIPQNITTYDPLLAQDEDLINMLSLVYESPLTVDSAGKFKPCLAETWQSDVTGTEFTFTIRNGVQLHNGDTLSAADVYQTILDVLALDGTLSTGSSGGTSPSASDSQAEATTGSFEASWTSGGGKASAGTSPVATAGSSGTQAQNTGVNRYAYYNKEIQSVTLADSNTILIKMKKAGRDALYFMTFPVRPQGADFKKPVGSGPYAVQSMEDSVKLAVNTKWWKVVPYLSAIEAMPISPNDEKIDEYKLGKLNFITTDNLAAGKLESAGKTQVVEFMTNYYDCLIPNLFEGSLKNDRVRQAISFAINRRTLISTVMLNHAVATEMPVSPGFFAFNTKYNTYQIDQDMAKELLAKEGYRTSVDGQGNILTLSIIVPQIIGEEYRVEAAKAIAKQLSDVGVTCTVEVLLQQEYAKRLKAGDFSLAYCSYYLNRNNDLSFMFNPGASGNFGNISSTELTADIAACNAAVNEADIIAAYDKLEQYFMDKVPQIGLYYRTGSIITDEALQDMSSLYENQIFNDIAAWSMQ